MSFSGNEGFLAVGKQTDKSTKQVTPANLYFVEAVSAPFIPVEDVRVRAPVLGESPLPRGMYKVGTGVQSGYGMEVTPSGVGPSLAYTLGADSLAHVYELDLTSLTSGDFTLTFEYDGVTGVDTAAIAFDADASTIQTAINLPASLSGAVVTEVTAAGTNGGKYIISGLTHASMDDEQVLSVDNGTVTHAGEHTLTMDSTSKYSVPYISVIRNVGDTIQEIGIGCKVAQAALSFSVDGAMGAEFGIVGLKPALDETSLTPVYDNEDVLTLVNSAADLTFVITDNAGTDHTFTPSNIDVQAVSFQMQNMMAPLNRRRKIGSAEAIDLTVLDRMAIIEVVMEISDAEFHNAATYAADNSWRETVATGNFSITAAAVNEFGQSVTLSSSNMVWSNFTLIPQPQDIVRATVTGTILRDGTNNEIKFVVTNSHTDNYLS